MLRAPAPIAVAMELSPVGLEAGIAGVVVPAGGARGAEVTAVAVAAAGLAATGAGAATGGGGAATGVGVGAAMKLPPGFEVASTGVPASVAAGAGAAVTPPAASMAYMHRRAGVLALCLDIMVINR